MGSHKRTAQLALEWMALMNVYPVVRGVNCFFRLICGRKFAPDRMDFPWSMHLLSIA
jgi:hypothetical protein